MMKAIPQFVQDLIKGVSTGLAVALPFLVIWLAFIYPKTFTFGYMKELSLLSLWLLSLVYLWPLKTLKAGKDGVHLEFHNPNDGILPKDAAAR